LKHFSPATSRHVIISKQLKSGNEPSCYHFIDQQVSNLEKNMFHYRIVILLALAAAIFVAAPNSQEQPPDSQAVIRRYRRSADPTTLSSAALMLLKKRKFYEQQKTRGQCYKTFYVRKLQLFTIS